MKIKMYTKAMCFPFGGAPYKKTMCVVYDSIDDINMVDGELVKDAEVPCRFGDTDGDILLSPLTQDAVFGIKKMLDMRLAGEDEETVRKYMMNFIAPALRKHR